MGTFCLGLDPISAGLGIKPSAGMRAAGGAAAAMDLGERKHPSMLYVWEVVVLPVWLKLVLVLEMLDVLLVLWACGPTSYPTLPS